MRAVALVPIVLVLAVAIGFLTLHSTGHDAHAKEMLAAAVTCLIAGEVATAPMLLTRHASQATVSQAALVGTVVHLFISIAIAAVVILGHLPLGQSYLYWLLGLYWATLIALVVGFVKAVRAAPVAG